MALKDDIMEVAEKYVEGNGYSGSLIDAFMEEAVNILDSLGETKFIEFIGTIYAGASGALKPGVSGAENAQKKDGSGNTVNVSMIISDNIKEQIRALIREEMGRAGRVETAETKPAVKDSVAETASTPESISTPAADTAAAPAPASVAKEKIEPLEADETVAQRPAASAPVIEGEDKIIEFYGKHIAAVMTGVADDLATIAGEKVKLTAGNPSVKRYSEVMASEGKFITAVGESEINEKVFIRMPANGAVKLSGAMNMIPDAVLKEKMTSLNLSATDIDGVKEVCNQAIGSINKGAIRKYKLKDIIFMDMNKEKEAVGDIEQPVISASYGLSIGAESYSAVTVCIPVAGASGIMTEGR